MIVFLPGCLAACVVEEKAGYRGISSAYASALVMLSETRRVPLVPPSAWMFFTLPEKHG